jgi:hypothetical protein
MTHAGGCLCGQVRFTIEAEPQGARICWCRDCQRIASGSPTVNVLFAADAVHYTGEITLFERVADSGNVVERGFCPSCGAQLFSRHKDGSGPTRVRAGTLDNPELMAPQAIIWTDSAPSWAVLDPALPHHPKGPESQPRHSGEA